MIEEKNKSEALLVANIDSGKALRQLMSRDKVNRTKMADVLNCTKPYVSSMRSSKGISYTKLVEVCGFFNISAVNFFRLGEE